MGQIHFISITYIFIFLIHAYHYLKYFAPLVFGKEQKKIDPPTEGVSILICAHNELSNLKSHLHYFLNQNYHDFEVLVINDRSEDGSKIWLQEQSEVHSHLRIINIDSTPEKFNSKKYALTVGIEKAKNEIILLSDADCQPASDQWVDKMSQCFTKNIAIVVGVSLYQKANGLINQFTRFETLQTALLYLSFANKKEAYMGVGRNLAYRKSFFESTDGFKGFSSILGGDDDLWVNRHANQENVAICTDPKALTLSIAKKSWRAFFKQKKRHLSVGKFYKFKDKLKIGIYHFAQSLAWILFILGCFLGNQTDCLILSLLFMLRLLGQYVVFYKLSTNIGIKFSHYNLLFLEILFIGYYWVWGGYATLTKHLTWK